MENLKVCRSCLYISDNGKDICNLYQMEGFNIFNKLMENSSVQMNEYDKCFICMKCLSLLNLFQNFQRMTVISSQILSCYKMNIDCHQTVISYLKSARENQLKTYYQQFNNLTLKLELVDVEVEKNIADVKTDGEDKHSDDFEWKLDENDFHLTKKPLSKSRDGNLNDLKRELSICHICGKTSFYINDHLISHRTELNWKCEKCEKQFASRGAWRKHQVVHDSSKMHICEECGASFSRKQVLTRHLRAVHYPTRKYECSICLRRFENNFNLKVHVMRHSGEKRFKCNLCTEQFASTSKLTQHKIQSHNVHPKQSFKCSHCKLVFIYRCQLVKHEKIHENGGKYQCRYCDEEFNKQPMYANHIRIKHKRTVNPEEELRCMICDKKFKQARCLKQHSKLHVDGKKFKCEICGKGFQYNSFLKEHRRVHTGERPAKCDFCDKAYITFRQLRKHLKTHQILN